MEWKFWNNCNCKLRIWRARVEGNSGNSSVDTNTTMKTTPWKCCHHTVASIKMTMSRLIQLLHMYLANAEWMPSAKTYKTQLLLFTAQIHWTNRHTGLLLHCSRRIIRTRHTKNKTAHQKPDSTRPTPTDWSKLACLLVSLSVSLQVYVWKKASQQQQQQCAH